MKLFDLSHFKENCPTEAKNYFQEILKKLYLENKERFYLIEEKYFACPPQFLDKKKFPYLIHFKGLQNKENFKSQINLINNYLDVVKKSL